MKYNLVLLCLVLGTSLYTPAAAEIDCNTPPEPVDHSVCCPLPELFAEEVLSKCEEYDGPMMPPPSSEDSQDAEDDSSRPRPRPHPHPHPHPHPRPHPHPPHHNPCFASCVLNETGILDSDQKFNEDSLQQLLEANLKEENLVWIPVLEMSFKTCAAKGEEMRAKWAARKEQKMASGTTPRMHHPRCPMAPGFLMGCVFMESFNNCPSSLWSNTDDCNAFRDHVKTCMPKFGKMHGGNRSGSVENNVE